MSSPAAGIAMSAHCRDAENVSRNVFVPFDSVTLCESEKRSVAESLLIDDSVGGTFNESVSLNTPVALLSTSVDEGDTVTAGVNEMEDVSDAFRVSESDTDSETATLDTVSLDDVECAPKLLVSLTVLEASPDAVAEFEASSDAVKDRVVLVDADTDDEMDVDGESDSVPVRVGEAESLSEVESVCDPLLETLGVCVMLGVVDTVVSSSS